MKQGNFVLENKKGEVVRVIQWDSSPVHVVYRHDSNRIETLNSTKELEEQKIVFTLIAKVTPAQVKKSSVKIADSLVLKWVDSIENYSRNLEAPNDKDKEQIFFYKWSAIAHVAFVAICFLSLLVSNLLEKPVEETVVIIPPKQHAPIQMVSAKVVERRVEKIKPVVQKKVKPTNAITHYKAKTPTKSKAVMKKAVAQKNLNNIGALAVLNNMNKSQRSRVSLSNLSNNATGLSPVKGSGGGLGSGSSGGTMSALYGKGLIAASPGSGSSQAQGASGYGTRGRGNGDPKYGSMSLVGSSQGIIEPPSEDIGITGGLDRDQIAAVINRNIGQIIYCYEQGLQVKPGMQGRVGVKFVIGTRGSVDTANIAQSSLGSSSVEKCIVNKLSSWKFPKPVGNVRVAVAYPFILKRLAQN